jgi:hypothetical protein
MKYLSELIDKHIDFNLVLTLIAILGTAGFVYLQFSDAKTEFEILNASTYSIIQSRGDDLRENISIKQELDELGKSLDDLNLN